MRWRPGALGRLADAFHGLAEALAQLAREREVLAAAVDGATLADIAAQLDLSEGTVRNHMSVAIQKLGCRNRIEAARLAEKKGWL